MNLQVSYPSLQLFYVFFFLNFVLVLMTIVYCLFEVMLIIL